jgi:hypothetical protein
MDAEGNLYATDGPVPPEDAERAKAWLAALDKLIERESARLVERERTRRLVTDPRAPIQTTGPTA